MANEVPRSDDFHGDNGAGTNNDENQNGQGSHSFHPSSSSPSSSSSMLRILCLHDANSNASELSEHLDAFAHRLFQNHGIDLVFVNSPLLARSTDSTSAKAASPVLQDPKCAPRVWWEEKVCTEESVGNDGDSDVVSSAGDLPGKENENTNERNEFTSPENYDDDDDTSGAEYGGSGGPRKRYVGMDASLLLLRQVWTSAPHWGILAVGQAASVASFLPLMELAPKPSFCIFVEGISVLEEDEQLIDNLPCLHIIGKNPCAATERLVRQFGGEVSAGITPTGRAALNRIGKFLVSQKKDLRRNQADINVLALQNQLYLAEQQAAHLVAQQIANDPPKALVAVITPKNVGGFSGGRRREPGEEGGGAPCPSEFLLHREKRTTNPNGPTRQHPNQQEEARPTQEQQG
mmetsp:Transcript_7445/g.11760  ORF Transcript_7445/g.11760 Transcript_7445/m.11760 type:complete len:405 (+) Transcript_7445:35-1249(+)